jgi:hypothetical protein
VEDEEHNDEGASEMNETNAKAITPYISFNALEDIVEVHTLRVTVKVKKHYIFVVIDFSSTHNF